MPALLVAVLGVAAAAVFASSAEPTYAGEVRKSLDQITKGIDKPSDPQVALSSNPYDYIRTNQDYQAIVALGFEALPALEAELDGTAANGLREYIICIAIEDITNCDLKQFPDSAWDRASVFRSNWDAYLHGMPERVSAIMSSGRTPAEKATELQKLGAPAIPFMLDADDKQDGALQVELARSARAAFGDGEGEGSLGDFRAQEADRVEIMREYVLAH